MALVYLAKLLLKHIFDRVLDWIETIESFYDEFCSWKNSDGQA